jgi:hypothetical protein
MNGTTATAVESPGTATASVKAAATTTPASSSSAATGERVIGNEADREKNEHRRSSEQITKHGDSSMIEVVCPAFR